MKTPVLGWKSVFRNVPFGFNLGKPQKKKKFFF